MIAFLLSLAFAAQAKFVVPQLTGPVVDEARILSSGARQRLHNLLADVHGQGGPQITVVTVKSLGGLTIEEASIQIADQWKLGSAKADNGVILLVAPNERRVRIEVGQGLEGNLPDIYASRIIREVIVPAMREGDVDGAITDGVTAILSYTDPEWAQAAPPPRVQYPKRRSSFPLELVLYIVLLVFAFISWALQGGRRGRRRGFWGSGGYGGYGGWSGGGGWGGSSGGGWSGGGGGFSGGGASGGW